MHEGGLKYVVHSVLHSRLAVFNHVACFQICGQPQNVRGVIGFLSVLVLLSRPVIFSVGMLMFSTLQTQCARDVVSRRWFPPRSMAFKANTKPMEERMSLVSLRSMLLFSTSQHDFDGARIFCVSSESAFFSTLGIQTQTLNSSMWQCL